MRRLACAVLALVVGGAVVTGYAATKSADEMVKEIEGMQRPAFDPAKREDQAYVQEYMKKYQAFQESQEEAMKGFVDAYPEDPRAAKMRGERWEMMMRGDGVEKVQGEVDAYLKEHPGDVEGLYMTAQVQVTKAQRREVDMSAAEGAVEKFIAAAPKDERGAALLFTIVRSRTRAGDRAVLERIAKDYPGTMTGKASEGKLRQMDGVGKPFELSFADAITGKPVEMKGLKGKVVVVDFWATWCGPCVGEMPKNKEIYAKFKPQGVEFIGVSLDQPESAGGLTALKEFVSKNGITWPQYYQGKGWESEFSSSWGITSIPAVFVVDAQGNLSSVNARGQLETLLPALIAKRDQTK